MTLAFIIGLLSALHCFGMCGGIVGALTMNLRHDIRQSTLQLAQYSLAYNTGRILSYVFAGLLFGIFGQVLADFLLPDTGALILRALAAIVVILLGIYVGGWSARVSLIEKLGQPVWRRMQPFGKKFLPVRKLHHALFFGAVWGWLPCGLVYYALVLAITRGNALDAALFMLLFGLGTLLPMMAAGILTGRLNRLRRSRLIQKINGSLLILFGLISLWILLAPIKGPTS